MGKIRTRVIGDEGVEKKQKDEQKKKSAEKKAHKIRAQGLKGGERMKQVEVSDESISKMQKGKELIEKMPTSAEATVGKERAKKAKKKSRGGNYKKSQKLVDKKKTYTLDEAIKLLKKMKFTKFDESVELHINVDSTGLKGEVALPHSTGKTTRIKIVDEKVLEDIGKGKLEFDILITHPQYMPKLARFAKLLGPKGLMPNPKAGTISPKPEEVAKKFQKGTLRWKTEPKFPLIHQMIGKISLEEKALMDNAVSFLSSVGKSHIQAVFVKTTMSPSVKININT
ncbi:hypothetical protein A2866_02370 [Candidatus Roizmanbacteria bacterium RIFCSPHIGHO2_01_FULL_39_8]|uniref:Large ribosomal subunit protein uL1 n=2 Tax=Candidatus Roizmaniibacteriota TaxID=1752723 RepID=A0A1F7GSH2_9BACT|nr:MAG: hypothetical protein A2866_02370 [Candidatus Roizmanbacteria bacterium RIFCSPHIGHO2_01_FULL_39_8]OGK25865.1 MAG: hypothetical protein A3C28_02715 [Candidatus Roizmanbacteria bacterium RIFCSPHIGHO2_02_FULL_39_9]